jgi:hypothetical protein
MMLVATHAHAQDATSCMERLSGATPDSARSTFAATVQSFNPRRPIPSQYAELLAEGVRQELKLPSNLVFPVFEADSIPSKASASQKSWMAVPSMSVVFGVTIDSGKMVRIRRIAGASSLPFDVAVANALSVLDSSALLPPLPPELGAEPLEISLAIMRMPLRTVRPIVANAGVSTIPLFRVLSPAHPVSQHVAPGTDFAKFVPQPPTRREDEAVTVRVTVRSDGTADQASMQVIAYSSTGYIKNVFDVIPNWTFQPMILNGCAVAAIEELTFTPGQGAPPKP